MLIFKLLFRNSLGLIILLPWDHFSLPRAIRQVAESSQKYLAVATSQWQAPYPWVWIISPTAFINCVLWSILNQQYSVIQSKSTPIQATYWSPIDDFLCRVCSCLKFLSNRGDTDVMVVIYIYSCMTDQLPVVKYQNSVLHCSMA